MKTKPQVLTVKGVKAKARAAYSRRKLTAQHRNPKKRICAYEVDTCRCVIGAALTKTTLKAIRKANKNNGSVMALRDAGIVRFDARIGSALNAIQAAHDAWALAARGVFGCCRDARRDFLKTIAA